MKRIIYLIFTLLFFVPAVHAASSTGDDFDLRSKDTSASTRMLSDATARHQTFLPARTRKPTFKGVEWKETMLSIREERSSIGSTPLLVSIGDRPTSKSYDVLIAEAHDAYMKKDYVKAMRSYEDAVFGLDLTNAAVMGSIPASVIYGFGLSCVRCRNIALGETLLQYGDTMPRDAFCATLLAADKIPGLK